MVLFLFVVVCLVLFLFVVVDWLVGCGGGDVVVVVVVVVATEVNYNNLSKLRLVLSASFEIETRVNSWNFKSSFTFRSVSTCCCDLTSFQCNFFCPICVWDSCPLPRSRVRNRFVGIESRIEYLIGESSPESLPAHPLVCNSRSQLAATYK